MEVSPHHPAYTISVVAQLLGLHEQTIRQYERLGLISPCRTIRKTRMYSQVDIERLECITYLVKTCGVNLSGVKIVITLSIQHPEIDELLRNKKFSPLGLMRDEISNATEEKEHGQQEKP
jgi:MerR family transcriptional regulator/heat shock protein HspR